MGYDIPDEIKYREKVVANLDLKQLGYVFLFGILAYLAYKLPIEGNAAFILPGIFGVLGIAFVFFNFDEKALDVLLDGSGDTSNAGCEHRQPRRHSLNDRQGKSLLEKRWK